LEFRNALRLRVFRKELTRAEMDRTIAQMLADLAAGIYLRREPDPSQLALEAERLSAGWSAKLGTRSLDVLHVACALELGASEFLTFDKRQAALAKAAGMSVPSL
jgi:predicted nucleic acid-binding protein